MGLMQQYAAYKDQDPNKTQTPFLSTAGRDTALAAGGTGQLVGGIFTGNAGMVKQGAKDIGKSVLSTITGGPLRALNAAPARSYVGGSQEALNQRYAQYGSGITGGQGIQNTGVGQQQLAQQQLIDASGMAGNNYQLGLGMMGQGNQLGSQALNTQGAALQDLRGIAAQDTGSVAAAQMQAGLDQMAGSNLGGAGGNALAMRDAMFANSQASVNAIPQLAALRAAEEQARIGRQMGAEQAAANAYGQNAQLGYGLQTQGLGQAQAAAGQYGGFGTNQGQLGLGLGNLGLGTQQLYTGAQLDTDKMQLDADLKHASASQAAKGGIMGVAGKVIGGIMGGGG